MVWTLVPNFIDVSQPHFYPAHWEGKSHTLLQVVVSGVEKRRKSPFPLFFYHPGRRRRRPGWKRVSNRLHVWNKFSHVKIFTLYYLQHRGFSWLLLVRRERLAASLTLARLWEVWARNYLWCLSVRGEENKLNFTCWLDGTTLPLLLELSWTRGTDGCCRTWLTDRRCAAEADHFDQGVPIWGFSRAFSHVVLFQINYLEEITQLSRGTVARYGQDVMTGAFCIVQKIVWNHVLDVDCVYCCYRLIFP